MRRRGILALGAGAVAACVRTPAPPPLRFDQAPPLELAVGGFTTEERMQAVAMDFIDRRRTDTLIGTTREYLSTRLIAVGGTDLGVGVIEEASVIERPLPPASGVLSVVRPGTELFGSLAVRVAIVDGFNVELAHARARAEMRSPVPTGASVVSRDRLAQTLARDLVLAIDRTLIQSIRANLGTWVATA